jgi:hypothetical protein
MIVNLYRPPSSSIPQFENDFSDLISSLLQFDVFIICGDFNLNIAVDPSTGDFIPTPSFRFLESLGLSQLVKSPTHVAGRILDLVLTHKDSSVVNDVSVIDGLSDHNAVLFTLCYPVSIVHRPVSMSFRQYRRLASETFSNDIFYSVTNPVVQLSPLPLSSNTELLFALYNTTVLNFIERNAPLRISKSSRKNVPWWSYRLRTLRRNMRQSEKKWKKTGLEVHRQIFLLQKSTFQKAIKDAKRVYLQDKVNSLADQPKRLWKVLNVSLGRSKQQCYPNSVSDSQLAHDFNHYFIDKIHLIRGGASPDSHPPDLLSSPPMTADVSCQTLSL